MKIGENAEERKGTVKHCFCLEFKKGFAVTFECRKMWEKVPLKDDVPMHFLFWKKWFRCAESRLGRSFFLAFGSH